MKKEQPPLRQKGQGEEIMVSGFLTPGGRQQVPENIMNDMLCNSELYPQWPHSEDGQPQRDAMVYL